MNGAQAEGDAARRDGVLRRVLKLRCPRDQRQGALEEAAGKVLYQSSLHADALFPYPWSVRLSQTRSGQCIQGRRNRIMVGMHGLQDVSHVTRSVRCQCLPYSESELSDTTPCSATDASSRSNGSPLGNAALAGSFVTPGKSGEQQALKVSLRVAPPVMP